jgi:SAM-dependent methyltransferase
MSKQFVRPCPVCGGTSGDVLYSLRFALTDINPLADHYDVVACDACQFAFADTASTQADYVRFYAQYSKYEDSLTSTGGGVQPLDARRLAIEGDLIAEASPDRAAHVVDVGCSNGGLLAALREHGFTDLIGIDPSPGCVRNTRTIPGVDAVVGSLSDIPAEIGPADLLLLTHVMEHIRDVEDAVHQLRKMLKPGGAVHIEVPDASRYIDYLVAPFQDFNTEHINHFSVRSLTNLMERCGFRCRASGELVLPTPPAHEGPVAYGLYVLESENAEPVPPTPDLQLRERIEAYIAASESMFERMSARFERAFAEHPALIIWGAGQLASKLLAQPYVRPDRIAGIVDSNPIHHGARLLGLPIIAPSEMSGNAGTAPIVIMTTLHQDEIEHQIRRGLGLPNPIVRLD